MEYSHIVRPSDLDRYSNTRTNQEVIPELIYRLVKQSAQNLSTCRIPYGDAINQSGWDGLVKTDKAFLEFVPQGMSYWEIGTGSNPQGKATIDFNKRTEELSKSDREKASFVFVTPRSSGSQGWSEPKQTAWVKERENKGWKLIRVIDGVKLADWLREFPAVGKWMATKVGIAKNLGSLSTPAEHWENLLCGTNSSDPPLPPKLFTKGRDNACTSLQKILEGENKILRLFIEDSQDIKDFVSAFLAKLDSDASRSYSDRCLYINDEETWRSVVEIRSAHVLVADIRLGLETDQGSELLTIAKRKGHSIIVPFCEAISKNTSEIIELRSPSQIQIEEALRESAYSVFRAQELARIGKHRISALRRYLQGFGTLPPYTKWTNATLIARVGLAGGWDGSSSADQSALNILLGREYNEWIETFRSDSLRPSAPMIQRDRLWRFITRDEVWDTLGNRVTDDDLDNLQETAVTVLGEQDPELDIPKEKRNIFMRSGERLKYSEFLRKGIAETLALTGSRSNALSSCSTEKATATATLVVRRLFDNANWKRWASLDSHLPLLAEAAPGEFLDAVESALADLSSTPFNEVFAQEGDDGIGGRHYMSWLLWALEGLAWSPDHLSRVSLILANLASIDPGGAWGNRPANSLTTIFLPWHVQTTATFAMRKAAISAVINEQPEIGYKVLLALLPRMHGSTTGCHQPIWREYIPRDWKNGVTHREYWEQITAFTNIMVALAKEDIQKLCELVERFQDLSDSTHEDILGHISSDAVISLPEPDRLPIWEKLENSARTHRKFSEATWALPEATVKKIEETANLIAPNAPELKYRYLFTNGLYDGKGSYEEKRKHLDKTRQEALVMILSDGDLSSVLDFAESVEMPYEVGRSLGIVASHQHENTLLGSHVDSENDTIFRVVAGFILSRFIKLKFDWVDKVLGRDWVPEKKAVFLKFLPFERGVWERVSNHLGKTHENLYWRNVSVNSYTPDFGVTMEVEKLIEYGRAGAAAMCIAHMADDKSRFDETLETLATRALLAAPESESAGSELDGYQTIELIKHLQESTTTDQNALLKIEWAFLQLLDQFSSGSPITLEKHLATDPSFFAEVIALVFRPINKNIEENQEPTEQQRRRAENAYELLTEWKRCPGTREDGTLDVDVFNAWINEVRRITKESGHTAMADMQIGRILTHAPTDPKGLWIHKAVAEILNHKDTADMRSEFTNELFNQRGVHSFSAGKEEKEIAQHSRKKADDLDAEGYTRFATAMREFAKLYEREAEREVIQHDIRSIY